MRYLAPALVVCLLASAAPAQQPPYLFGPPDLSVAEQVTPLGIRYRAFGFDNLGAKRVNKKLVNQLRARGVPESTIQEVRDYAQFFIGNPGYIGSLIDAAYTERRNAFLSCGPGTWQHRAATSATPGSFVVTIEPTLFLASGYGQTVWTIDAATDSELRAVVVYIEGLLTYPTQATRVAKLHGTLAWGIGEVIHRKGEHQPRSVAEEIGSGAPCR